MERFAVYKENYRGDIVVVAVFDTAAKAWAWAEYVDGWVVAV